MANRRVTKGAVWPSDDAQNAPAPAPAQAPAPTMQDIMAAVNKLQAENANLRAQLQAGAKKAPYTNESRRANLAKGRETLKAKREAGLLPARTAGREGIAVDDEHKKVTGRERVSGAPIRTNDVSYVGGVPVYNPHGPAKSRQTWTLFLLTGQDVRNTGLTKLQAVERIGALKAKGVKPFAWKNDAKNAATRETESASRKHTGVMDKIARTLGLI